MRSPPPTCFARRGRSKRASVRGRSRPATSWRAPTSTKPLIVAQRNGASVRLTDVANVYDGVQDRYNTGFFNDKEAVLLIVSRQPDANIIETVDAITAQLPTLRAFLPAGVALAVASDRSPGIRATLHEAERTLLIAVTLVILVVLLFLASFRASIIPVAAVPVALVGSFGVMYLWGFSLNNLSLMALIVATGLVVDDAIVVLENISRHVELGKSPFEAAIIGAKEVGWTLLSMNLSLVAVFISILFMGGIVERLFREFSITLVAAIMISLLVSLTLTPMLCSRWLTRRDEAHRNIFQRISDKAYGWLLRGYDATLGWALRHAPLVVCLLLGVMALNVSLYIAAPKSFLPNQDTGQLGGFIRGDDGPVVPGDAAEDSGVPPRGARRPGGREHGRLHRRRRRHQQRADLRAAQAAARAEDSARRRWWSASTAACRTCRARACVCLSIRTSASAAAAAVAAAGRIRVRAAGRRHQVVARLGRTRAEGARGAAGTDRDRRRARRRASRSR